MANSSSGKFILPIIVIVVLGTLGYFALNMPDQRTTGQHIGDAVDALPQGADKAARELKDRTPSDRIKDAVKDNTSHN